jgi:hypothetical protein
VGDRQHCSFGQTFQWAFPGWFMVVMTDQLIGTPTFGDLVSLTIAYDVMRGTARMDD